MQTEFVNRTWVQADIDPSPSEPGSKPRRNFVPPVLFLMTVFSTVWAGCLHENIDVFAEPWLFYRGLPFSLTLLLILAVHESGHYLFCRIHGIPSTVPYFIPMPNFLGTMGAFIRIKGAVRTRRALMDIGMAGPLAGFAVALPATLIGYRMSEITPHIQSDGMLLGESLLTWLIGKLVLDPVPAGQMILLHPIGFAGYIGLFVTAMNLLPVGQLDGGHITASLLGARQAQIGRLTVYLLMVLGLFWQGWWIWAIILLMSGTTHPAIRHDARPPGRLRTLLAWLTIAILVVTFVPVPFSFGSFTP